MFKIIITLALIAMPGAAFAQNTTPLNIFTAVDNRNAAYVLSGIINNIYESIGGDSRIKSKIVDAAEVCVGTSAFLGSINVYVPLNNRIEVTIMCVDKLIPFYCFHRGVWDNSIINFSSNRHYKKLKKMLIKYCK